MQSRLRSTFPLSVVTLTIVATATGLMAQQKAPIPDCQGSGGSPEGRKRDVWRSLSTSQERC